MSSLSVEIIDRMESVYYFKLVSCLQVNCLQVPYLLYYCSDERPTCNHTPQDDCRFE